MFVHLVSWYPVWFYKKGFSLDLKFLCYCLWCVLWVAHPYAYLWPVDTIMDRRESDGSIWPWGFDTYLSQKNVRLNMHQFLWFYYTRWFALLSIWLGMFVFYGLKISLVPFQVWKYGFDAIMPLSQTLICVIGLGTTFLLGIAIVLRVEVPDPEFDADSDADSVEGVEKREPTPIVAWRSRLRGFFSVTTYARCLSLCSWCGSSYREFSDGSDSDGEFSDSDGEFTEGHTSRLLVVEERVRDMGPRGPVLVGQHVQDVCPHCHIRLTVFRIPRKLPCGQCGRQLALGDRAAECWPCKYIGCSSCHASIV